MISRKEATRLVKTFNGAAAWVAACPFCKDCAVTFRKSKFVASTTWGDRTKAKATVAAHIIERHPEATPKPRT